MHVHQVPPPNPFLPLGPIQRTSQICSTVPVDWCLCPISFGFLLTVWHVRVAACACALFNFVLKRPSGALIEHQIFRDRLKQDPIHQVIVLHSLPLSSLTWAMQGYHLWTLKVWQWIEKRKMLIEVSVLQCCRRGMIYGAFHVQAHRKLKAGHLKCCGCGSMTCPWCWYWHVIKRLKIARSWLTVLQQVTLV